jgi:hypothetical protein
LACAFLCSFSPHCFFYRLSRLVDKAITQEAT